MDENNIFGREKDEENEDSNEEIDNTPQDDEGIRADQIIDICEFTINRCWSELFENNNREKISLDDLDKCLNLASRAWVLGIETVNNSIHFTEEMTEADSDEDDEDFDEENGEE